MNRKMISTAIALLFISLLCINGRHRTHAMVSDPSIQKSTHADVLAKKTGRADRTKYYPIVEPWQNPTVFVELNRISIILAGQSERLTTSVDDLAKELAELPASAWPLGRVVVFAQSARIPILLEGFSLSEQELEARRNAGKVLEILKSLDLEIVHAPIN